MEKKQNIKISAIIPAFNSEETISRAIDSILNQTLPPHEIIVIDDGSEDDTKKKVLKYGNKVKYEYQKNKGPGVARNLGANIAEGDYLAFLDADDIWYAYHLSSAQKIFNKHPQLKWYGSAYNRKKDEALNTIIYSGEYYYDEKIINYFHAQIESYFQIIHMDNLVVDKLTFFAVKGFDDFYRTQDRLLYFKLAFWYPELGYCIHPSSEYIKRPGSLVSQYKILSQPIEVISYIDSYIENHNSKYLLDAKLYLNYLVKEKCNESISQAQLDILKKLLYYFKNNLSTSTYYKYFAISKSFKLRNIYLRVKRRLKLHLNIDI